MRTSFDPYHKWLGIPPEEQPPDYYRLLGLKRFEPDADVISYAADQRMGLLKTFASGEFSSQAEVLLNEVARAKVCLLNSTKRQAYDATLSPASAGVAPALEREETALGAEAREQASHLLVIACPQCGKEFEYRLMLAAQVVSCRSCGANVVLPGIMDMAKAAAKLAENHPSVSPGHSSEIARDDSHGLEEAAKEIESREFQHIGDSSVIFSSSPPSTSFAAFGNVKRRRPSASWGLFKIFVGAMVGLFAGYVVLCMIGLRYDFLHLFADKDNKGRPEQNASARGDIVQPRAPAIDQERARPQVNPPKIERRKADPPARKNGKVEVPHGLQHPNDDKLNNSPRQVVDAFAHLPQQLSIPSPLPINVAIDLFVVPLDELDNLELEILGGQEPGETKLVMKRLLPAEAPWSWIVEDEDNATVARFAVKENALSFKWSDSPSVTAVAALRNSVLKVRANQVDHFVALRTPVTLEPLTIDLDRSIDRATCKCDDLPDVNCLRADVLALDDSPPYFSAGAGLLALKLNDETIIHFNAAQEASIGIKFVLYHDLPSIEVRCHYRLPSGTEDSMEIRRGNRRIAGLRRSLAARPDAGLSADLEALERVGKIATLLHEKVKIKFRFYHFVQGQEVELASTGR